MHGTSSQSVAHFQRVPSHTCELGTTPCAAEEAGAPAAAALKSATTIPNTHTRAHGSGVQARELPIKAVYFPYACRAPKCPPPDVRRAHVFETLPRASSMPITKPALVISLYGLFPCSYRSLYTVHTPDSCSRRKTICCCDPLNSSAAGQSSSWYPAFHSAGAIWS